MNRRDLISLLWLAGCGLSAAQADPGKDVIGMVTVTVYQGTNGNASAAGQRAKAADPAIVKRLAGEQKLKFTHYLELGKDTKPLFRSYENWAQPLPPSDEILLRFEAQSILSKERRRRLDIELWLSRKKILKTDAAMEPGKPLLVLGPEWRGGRLIIAAELAPPPAKGK
ncbi:hypothetical protein OKA05_18970 [Luteolibacter arcticus]|uniref:Chalcone isomerase domain-containing protein n=1 Tax=Luteolibacter arcticus TaxID=1581411 RepID=A0ABT3GMA1_9BACT|nr:hypothetical protein [Luteolibacter arcticus]MCW1924655.1 hypothetical protein [Luteolibacter arcticus]